MEMKWKVLEKGQLQSFTPEPLTLLIVKGGTLWVTQEGDPRDILLASSQKLLLEHSGKVVLEALEAGTRYLLVSYRKVLQPVKADAGKGTGELAFDRSRPARYSF